MRDAIEEILQKHVERLRIRGDTFAGGGCPFHKETTPGRPFCVNLETGSCGCWSCHAGGPTIQTFLEALGLPLGNLKSVIKYAQEEAKKTSQLKKVVRESRARADFRGTSMLPDSVLGVFDWRPVELVNAGFDEGLLRQQEIGYDQERSRITYPLRDVYGNLVGISGGTVINAEPKYKVYEGWHQNGEGQRVPGEFGDWFKGTPFAEYSSGDVRNHLWGGHSVYEKIYEGNDNELYIVEGFKARLWLLQHEWMNTVALMGSSMTKQQERLIRRLGTPIWIFLDNDRAGRKGADIICDRIGGSSFPVHLCFYPDELDDVLFRPQFVEAVEEGQKDLEDAQPDDLTGEGLEWVLVNAPIVGGRLQWRQ